MMMLVMAGKPVDDFIELLLEGGAEEGDIIIDGGNSHYPDTNRRTNYLKSKGIRFVGTGVSGGEEGARYGPSIMPGGNEEAWPYIKDVFQDIAAKSDGEPCCDWVGDQGAGHYVKMVHNGIEYGDMQLICEAYDILKRGVGLTNKEIGDEGAGHYVKMVHNGIEYGDMQLICEVRRAGCTEKKNTTDKTRPTTS